MTNETNNLPSIKMPRQRQLFNDDIDGQPNIADQLPHWKSVHEREKAATAKLRREKLEAGPVMQLDVVHSYTGQMINQLIPFQERVANIGDPDLSAELSAIVDTVTELVGVVSKQAGIE